MSYSVFNTLLAGVFNDQLPECHAACILHWADFFIKFKVKIFVGKGCVVFSNG